MEVVKQEYKPRFPVDQLREHEANPNRGDDEAVAGLIDANGFYGACVVQKSTGRILVGNTRYRSALSRGAKTIPVLLVDVDDDHARSIMVGDNRGRDLSHGYDNTSLAALLTSLAESDRGLGGSGYDGDDLADLLASLAADPRNEVTPFNPDATSDDFYTPAWVFERLGLKFDTDPCSPPVWLNPPYSNPTPWMLRFRNHGNGVALVPCSKGAWFVDTFNDPNVAMCSTPANMKFVGGGIAFHTVFVAMGSVCTQALANLGPVRTLAGGQP